MNLPSISAITPVYGGVAWLEQAIACFLAQDYQGPHEMLVVNSCPAQTLVGEFPKVRIVNLGFRPESLGELRNLCVMDALGDWIVIADSDDIFLPNHLSNFAAHCDGNDWIWLTPQFWILGEDIKSVVPGACPLFSYTKKAWHDVGRYPSLTVGEDAGLISKITEKFKGQKVQLPLDKISFGYRWGDGNYHVSGEGHDRAGMKTAHERARLALEDRIRHGHEKTGVIKLKPNLPQDWRWKANDYLTNHTDDSQKKTVAIVELGRFGDICNILPIAQHIAETYAKPHLIVSKEFASLLEGCSYVEPYPVDLKNAQINEALAIANREFKFVVNCQIWGQNFEIVKQCASYNRESWRMAGFAHKFDDKDWRPVFDRRDAGREEALWRKLDNGKPMVLVNLTKSVSSPYKGTDTMMFIKESRPQFNVVDVADLVLHRIYDLVGLIERAACVISIDTAMLHLSAATDTRVVAIINAAVWLGSEVRCKPVSVATYATVTREFVLHGIDLAVSEIVPAFKPPQVVTAPERKLIHCVERHTESNPKEQVRKAIAQVSWDVLYADGVVPAHMWNYPRNALSIGDIRPLPFLKDLLRFGMDQAGDDDIIFWTNDDNYLHKDLADLLRFHVAVYDVCTSQRIEFKNSSFPSTPKPPHIWKEFDSGHMGRDLFAATKRWLLKHWEELPDFILGASDFDLCLACMVRRHFNIEPTRANIEGTMWPAEIERGYVAHQYHTPKWRDPDNIHSGAAQRWNRDKFRVWAKDRLPNLIFNADGCI